MSRNTEKEEPPGEDVKSAVFPPLVAALTLGLAPFFPEPHIWGKIKWVAGGAVGMKPLDWFDLVLHGAPWIWLGATLVRMLLVGKGASAPKA